MSPVDFLKQTVKSNKGTILTEDNFVYDENYNYGNIYAQLNDTIIRLTAPPEYRDFDIMRELCQNIIDSVETVVVKNPLLSWKNAFRVIICLPVVAVLLFIGRHIIFKIYYP